MSDFNTSQKTSSFQRPSPRSAPGSTSQGLPHASLDDAKRRIIAKVPLESLIQETLPLTRRGARLTGLCPFHSEKSPSFYVFHDHYHCFGCHAHGDAITFVRQTRDLGFVQALRFLADKYGVEAPELELTAKGQRRRDDVAQLSKIMLLAQEFFTSQVKEEVTGNALQYLKDRGFTEESIAAFGFGLTPKESYGLVRYLRQRHFRDDDLVKVGLASISAHSGQLYDFFRDRITIPIRDAAGRIVGFGGRTTQNDPAKYKNTAQTVLFDKGQILFGLDHAKPFIKESSKAIVVEGYMDALFLWQAGFNNTVACMGTALNVRHLKQLQSVAKAQEVFLLFDGDRAGQNASLNAIETALNAPGLNVKVATIPDGEDPDSFVRQSGPSALTELLSKAEGIVEFSIEKHLKGQPLSQVPHIVSTIFIPWLAQIPDRVQRSFLTARIAGRTGVSTAVIETQIRSFAPQARITDRLLEAKPLVEAPSEPEIVLLPTRPLNPIEHSFLGHLFHSTAAEIKPEVAEAMLTKTLALEPLWDEFAHSIIAMLKEGKTPNQEVSSLLSQFTAEETPFLAAISESKSDSFVTTSKQECLDKISKEIRKLQIQSQINELKILVARQSSSDAESTQDYLRKIMELHSALKS
jgi:DNA primase